MTGASIPVELSPVHIEQKLLSLSNEIAKSVSVTNDAYVTYLGADRAFDVAWARAILSSDGPEYVRRAKAELGVVKERTARDIADAAYRYAEKRSRALQEELKAYQSVGASIRAQFAVVGRGEY